MSSWGVALRMGRREARRARGRSALVLAMIGLPVLGVTAVAVTAATSSLSTEQRATRSMGAADLTLTDTGGPAIVQNASGQGFSSDSPVAGTAAPDPSRALALLPPGSRSLPDTTVPGELTVGDRTAEAELRELAYAEPLARGLYRQVAGRPPTGPAEVDLTTALAHRLGARVGAVVQLTRPAARLRVVGVVASTSRTDALGALVSGGLLPAATPPNRLLVDLPGPVRWATVTRLNRAGLLAEPRRPVADAPPEPDRSAPSARTVTTVALVVGLALLEVVLLAGPAFAVGARRQTRELALLSATGAEPRDVRRVVLASGLVLGLAAGALGVVLGVAAGRLLVPLLVARTHTLAGPFEVPALQVLAVLAVAVGTALLAAVVPARLAARQDVVAGLTGRRGIVVSRRWVPVAGIAGAAVGALVARAGAQHHDAVILLLGSAIAELGLVATTPALVGAAGRLGPRLPATARLALRDASRNRSRTAPAVSAVLAAVAGAVAVGTYVASIDGRDRERYSDSAAPGTVVVGNLMPGREVETAGRVLRAQLPGARVVPVRAADFTSGYLAVEPAPEQACPLNVLTAPPTRAQVRHAVRDPRCRVPDTITRIGSGTVVGGPDELAALTGVRSAATTAVLLRGGVVAPPESVQADGTVRASFQVITNDGRPPVDAKPVALPGRALPRGVPRYTVVSPAAAARLGVASSAQGVVAVLGHPVGTATEDRVRSALRKAGLQTDPYVERGYRSSIGPVLLALVAGSALLVVGAASIATGLAAAEGRADLATLAAVGASPSLRRGLAGLQSAVTAGLGALLGTLTGLVPAVGLVRALNSAAEQSGGLRTGVIPVVVPWGHLAVAAVLAPVVAALAAAALTRSRLPMVRRLA